MNSHSTAEDPGNVGALLVDTVLMENGKTRYYQKTVCTEEKNRISKFNTDLFVDVQQSTSY